MSRRTAALSRPNGIRNGTYTGGSDSSTQRTYRSASAMDCTTTSSSSSISRQGASPMVCYALRLRPGEELKGALTDFVSDRGIRVREAKSFLDIISPATAVSCARASPTPIVLFGGPNYYARDVLPVL